MLKQRILAIIVGIAVIIAGYFIFTTSAEQFIDYQIYQQVKVELFSQSSYQENLNEAEIEALLRVENNEFKISVVLAKPTQNMYGLKLLVITNSNEARSGQQIYPSLGLIDQQTINLITEGTIDQINKNGIVLSYVSVQNVSEILVYLSYLDESNQVIKRYIKLTPKI